MIAVTKSAPDVAEGNQATYTFSITNTLVSGAAQTFYRLELF